MARRKAKAAEPDDTRTQVQKLLAKIARVKLTTVERAVLCELLARPGYRIERGNELWPDAYAKYHSRRNPELLPYTRQGLTNALKSLERRGWIEIERPRWTKFGEGRASLLPIGVLGTKTS